MIWFTSDTHFGHSRILELGGGRPFASVEEMDAAPIKRWNDRVAKSDHVYHLGDFALCGRARIDEIAAQLNGKIFLVKGNHDHAVPRRTKGYHVEIRPDLAEQKIGEQRVVMCHYALLTWNCSRHGAWMLHGHSHGALKTDDNVKRLDVGVDAHDFCPWPFDEVVDYMRGRGVLNHHEVENGVA